jgi:hypothetical protein
MSYILKNTSGLVNTRLTDTAREKLSQGNFNISYFQIGDGEVSYNSLPSSYNQFNTNILEPNFNSQNSSGAPNSNKQYVKYPYYVDGVSGNTYGIPFMDSIVSPVYNRAAARGFFKTNFTATTLNWSANTDSEHVINSNYIVDMSTLTGGTTIKLIYSGCNTDIVRLPAVGDLITIFYDGKGCTNCACTNVPTPTPTPTPSITPTIYASPTPTPTSTNTDPCGSPTPTPTPSATFCPTPTPSKACNNTPIADCVMGMSSCYSMLTYKIVNICLGDYTLDRPTPDFTSFNAECDARVLIYPPNMTSLYDSITPMSHWNQDVINFESVCNTDAFDVKVWNMNIPWSESPAGLYESSYKGYSDFGSIGYLGSKEYLGYMSNSGQTFYVNSVFSSETTDTYYYNSFGEVVDVEPKDQKAIAIIHYTNQSIDYFYGEKFALEPYDPTNPADTTGQARNFKLHIPWLMWHKNPNCCLGQTFYVDPAGFDGLNLFQVHYMESNKNNDMNSPGLRYYNLWDNNPNIDGIPNRVGKVFPDQKIVVIDDEEIIAAMSYKSNRNWTLPSPKTTLVTPNTCGTDNQSSTGVLTGKTDYMYVTYRFTNTQGFTNSLHCNYYTKIQGPNIECNPITSQNVAVRFGNEFPCLTYSYTPPSTTTTTTIFPTTTTTTIPVTTTTTTLCPQTCDIFQGFVAEKFEIICQKVTGDIRPDADEWKIIDFTSQLSGQTINGYITQDAMTGATFVITDDLYNTAPYYNLNDYIQLTPQGDNGTQLNFGDEYYFYGTIETDIQATIYEMRYKINLGQAEFQASSNPTWNTTDKPYITEIGLYDSDKNLMIISKLQSPVLRQGIQQFLVKFDF